MQHRNMFVIFKTYKQVLRSALTLEVHLKQTKKQLTAPFLLLLFLHKEMRTS